jgi:ectoine hydroxylase-related dioxygenase (phytanoyl-CoA dioxygenase family)
VQLVERELVELGDDRVELFGELVVAGGDRVRLRSVDRSRHEFDEDGATVLRGVLTGDWLTELAAGVEQNLADPGPWASEYTAEGGRGRFFGDYVNWSRIEPFRRVALHSPLADAACRLLEPGPVRFFHEHVLVKEPGTGEATPWHHDQPYYCVDGRSHLSLWVPLDPVAAADGLVFVAGSHRWGRRFVPRRFLDHVPYAPGDDRYELVPDIDAEAPRHRLLRFDVEPGDAVAFHFTTVHAAPGNARTDVRRRAVSFRYLGADATFAERPWLHSPPFEARDLAVGGPLDDDRFPIVTPDPRAGGTSPPQTLGRPEPLG